MSLRPLILGTAGHIDHGKTTLVKALTGIDTDRLPEERARGMTIELGFAVLRLPSLELGVVDVPGHERFVRTMVAGATGIDMAMLVVAADDSVMPQTREHVDILKLLGVRHGVVAITKSDVVDAEMVELVRLDVAALLAGTPLERAPIVAVSAQTGAGLENLRTALAEAAAQITVSHEAPPFRMAIDRVFSVAGRGTVVTGSVLRGTVRVGETLQIMPGGQLCRLREAQSHGMNCEAVSRGRRAALNLVGVEREHIARGAELATPEYLVATRMLDVYVTCLPDAPRPLKSLATVRLGIGTGEHRARLALLEHEALVPGTSGFAQLRCGEPLVAAYGQHFILRDENAARTLGGGIILRPDARQRRRPIPDEHRALTTLLEGSPTARMEEALRHAGTKPPSELRLCAMTGIETADLPKFLTALHDGGRLVRFQGAEASVPLGAVDDLRDRLIGWLARYHRRHEETPGRPRDAVVGYLERTAGRAVARELLDLFVRKGVVKELGRFVCLPEFAPRLSPADETLLQSMIGQWEQGGFQPPSLNELNLPAKADPKRRQKLAALAVAFGEVVQLDADLYLHARNEARLRSIVEEMIAEQGAVAVGAVRERIGSSRKYVVPMMEYLDRIGFTRRVGDQRILASAAPKTTKQNGGSAGA